MKRIAIFASGSGSNAERIATYFADNDEISVALVLTNKSNAQVLERCKRLKLPALYFNREAFYNSDTITALLKASQIDLVVLAGFLWKVPEPLIREFEGRIVNIHPALLPKFGGKGMYGMRVHEAVLQSGESESGITIHFVNEHYDEGATIYQARVLIEDGDDAEQLAKKVQALEHEHFPRILEELLQNG